MQIPPPSLQTRPRFGLQDFPDRLDAWLDYLAWKVPALAALSNVARSLISKWLGGHSSPSMKSAGKVVEVLGLSPCALFDETPWERVRRCLMASASADDGRQPARLSQVLGLRRGDFVACVNRVPVEAVPLLDPGTGIVEFLSGDGLDALVGLPLFGAEQYPMARPGQRAATVVSSLEQLDDELRRWRYADDDRALIAGSIQTIRGLDAAGGDTD